MPAALAIPAIIAAAGTAAETGIQAYSANKAAKQQQASGQQALDLQKQVLAQQQQNLSPFINAGTSSLSRLNSYLTPQGQMPTNIMAPAATGGNIMVIAPDGSIQQMRPASERAHWESLGATVRDLGGAVPQMPAAMHSRGAQAPASMASALGGR